MAAIHTSVRFKTPSLPPLHSKQEPINWWTPVQSCSSKIWASSCAASNLDRGRRGTHKFVNAASHFVPLGYFLESVDVREASLPLITHHITSHHITLHHVTSHHLLLLQHPFNVMMDISLQWHDGIKMCASWSTAWQTCSCAFSDKEIPTRLGYYCACCANIGGGGGSTAIRTYIHVFYLGYIGMTAVKVMVFKQFILG